ncbi:hypothetical protein LCGC14_1774590 [marine sediment metagenome]|uniref:Uncharacterized protein n=1 Tax=marine sediment metagenome TaxID=412755 RepID=A0A0F9GX73_9ZZZZ
MLKIDVTITDENGKVILFSRFKRSEAQGNQPQGYRYFEPNGWVISIVPPTPDHKNVD